MNMNSDHHWNCIKESSCWMDWLYSHIYYISYIIIPDSAKSVESSRIQPPEKLTLDFQCVVFLMIETHLIGLKYARVRKQILHVHICIYIHIHETIFTCIYVTKYT